MFVTRFCPMGFIVSYAAGRNRSINTYRTSYEVHVLVVVVVVIRSANKLGIKKKLVKYLSVTFN